MGPASTDTGRSRPAHRRQPRIDYFVAFDCLAQPQAVLAGYVRQQEGKTSSFASLAERWRWRLNDLRLLQDPTSQAPANAVELLDNAGFDGAALSLFYRPASAEERVAFELLSERVGRVLKCLVPDSEGQWRTVGQTGLSIPGSPVKLPDVLAGAGLASIAPKLITDTRSKLTGHTLAEAITQFPLGPGDLVRERLVDVTALAPCALASMAETGRASSIMRAAGLDGWTFEVRQRSWSASHDNNIRRISVREADYQLVVELQLHGSSTVRELGSAMLPVHPDGYVAALLRFLHPLQRVLAGAATPSSASMRDL